MDKISGLPDELLVKILSFVPNKVAVSTSIFSKRWKFLWMWLPKLDYTGRAGNSPLVLRDFINKSLPLHRALVIESLRLSLWEELSDSHIIPEDIKRWVEIAVSRYVRELEISCCHTMFLDSLVTCKSLVILKLKFVTLMDVPSMVCFPSLKILQLVMVEYADEKPFKALLSICPVLEDLEVSFSGDENFQEFTVIVPSLQKLSLNLSGTWGSLEWYEIDTPCLKYLKLHDRNENPCLFKNMPKLREAHVDIESFALKSITGSITSVKHLSVCSEDVYGDGFVFDQLEHLELCTCLDNSSNLLAPISQRFS